MELTDLIKFAITGPTAICYGLLNVVVGVAHRYSILSQTWGFMVAAAVGGFVGAMSGLIEATASVGVAPAVLMNSVLIGMIIGSGSSTLIGLAISKALDASGLIPISQDKIQSEKVRNPMDPTMPPSRP